VNTQGNYIVEQYNQSKDCQGRKGQLTNAADIRPDEKEYRNKWTQTTKHEDIKTFQTRIYSSTI